MNSLVVQYHKLYLLLILSFPSICMAQLEDQCKLNIGTNLGGLADYATEIPFVDLMKSSREWYTQSIGDPNSPFDSGFADELALREDGYPTHVPQVVNGSIYEQQVATIWGRTDGWPEGNYTILFDGTGELSFIGPFSNLVQTNDNRYTLDIANPIGNIFQLLIESSDINDPIRNIRVLMPGTEDSYESQPFYTKWLDLVDTFLTVRFMDWGSTNGWGQTVAGDFGDETLYDWNDRSQPDFYTWTHSKGVPYEMMVEFLNQTDKDGWVCVPHTASEDYIRKMARYFRDNLEPERHIYVEYSNEIWNWIFPQTHWTNHYGCELTGTPWPEGTVPYIQRMLDYWSDEYEGQLDRTTRVVGVFTGWLDVAQRVAFNLDETSFDAISPTYYFGFSEEGEAQLDQLGNNASVADIAQKARENMDSSLQLVSDIKTELADEINKPLAFYEGGQHITPNPFGVEPSYAESLLAIHRDTSMYNLYNEWFGMIRTLQEGDEPLLLMNFSFIAYPSSQYGSWGLLESMNQDINEIPAPKYQAVLENMNTGCMPVSVQENEEITEDLIVYPNPSNGIFTLGLKGGDYEVYIYNFQGRFLRKVELGPDGILDLSTEHPGIYTIEVGTSKNKTLYRAKVIKI